MMINLDKKDLLRRSLFYIIPFIAGLVYWLAFYPGIMSFDSIFQWDQLATFKFTNWHPAIHTILMYVLTRIWYSPAIVSLFQIIIAGLVIGYGLNTIRKASRLPDYIFIALGVLIAINPIVGIMDITLWKDVLYSLAVLLLTIFLFEIIASQGRWFSKPLNIVLYGAILSFIWLLRYNGAAVVVASLIITPFFYKKYLRSIIYSSLVTMMLIIFIRGPIYSLFKVNKSINQPYAIVLVHPVDAYVNDNPKLPFLSDAEKQYLDRIYPLKNSWAYSCYDATVLFYKRVNIDPVNEDPMRLVTIFAKLAVQNPKILLHHFMCVSSFVWQLNQPEGVYLETILMDSYNPEQVQSWSKYDSQVIQPSLLPRIRSVIQRLVTNEWNADAYKVIWRPALYMYLFLGSIAFLTVRVRNKIWLLLSVPLVAQSIGIMLTTQMQALRYQYAVYLISMLFTIPILSMGIQYITPAPKKNVQND
jgi:hypothetical protein